MIYMHSLSHFNEWAIKPGNVHFNEDGSLALGVEVGRVIREVLSLNAHRQDE